VSNRKAFFNGQFIDEDKAALHVSDLSIQRGYGIFDFFRTIEHVPLFLDDYLDRFYRSAEALRLPVDLNRDKLTSVIQELIDQNKIPESGIRLTLTGGYSPDSYELAIPNFLITQVVLKPMPARWTENGMKLITHEYLRDLPFVKSINYLTAVWLQEKVRHAKADDILYHKNNEVSELPRSNFFIVTKDDVIVTPGNNILHGITRMKLLEMASALYKIEERTLTLHEVLDAKEAFMTSTTKQLVPIVQIDNNTIGNGRPGAITTALNTRFRVLCDEFCRKLAL
jgi:branched-chain amino acid aminotransferase